MEAQNIKEEIEMGHFNHQAPSNHDDEDFSMGNILFSSAIYGFFGFLYGMHKDGGCLKKGIIAYIVVFVIMMLLQLLVKFLPKSNNDGCDCFPP